MRKRNHPAGIRLRGKEDSRKSVGSAVRLGLVGSRRTQLSNWEGGLAQRGRQAGGFTLERNLNLIRKLSPLISNIDVHREEQSSKRGRLKAVSTRRSRIVVKQFS